MRVGRHSFHGTAESMLRELEKVNAEDDAAERRSRVLGWWTVLTAIAAVVALMVGLGNDQYWMLFLLPVPIVLGALYSTTKQHDVDDRKLESAISLLRVLRADIPRREPVALTLDFRTPQRGGRLTEKIGGGWGKTTVYRYEHGWFDLTTNLADGNALTLGVVADVVRKEKPKRKYMKVRQRTSERLECVVRLAEHYGDPAAAVQRLKRMPAPDILTVRSVAASAGRVRVRLETGNHVITTSRRGTASTDECRITGDALLSATMWLYGGLAPRGA